MAHYETNAGGPQDKNRPGKRHARLWAEVMITTSAKHRTRIAAGVAITILAISVSWSPLVAPNAHAGVTIDGISVGDTNIVLQWRAKKVRAYQVHQSSDLTKSNDWQT